MEEKKKSHKIIWFVAGFFLLALIITVVLPAFKPVKDGIGYTKVKCMSNMRYLALACMLYQDEKGSWLDKGSWNDLIKSYDVNEEAFRCYVDKTGPCSYAMNEAIPADANSLLPSDLVVLFESTPGWNHVGGPEDMITDRHNGCWVSFGDSHIDFIETEDIPNLRWTIQDAGFPPSRE